MADNNVVMTGGRAQFLMNNREMGMGLGVNVREQIGQEPVRVLNHLAPIGFSTVSYDVSVTVRLYRVPYQDIVEAGIWPQMGKTHLEMKTLLLAFEPMSATLIDSKTGAKVGKVTGLVPNSRDVGFETRGLTMSNLQMSGIFFSDEGSPSV